MKKTNIVFVVVLTVLLSSITVFAEDIDENSEGYTMGFVDYTEFSNYWYKGVFRCPDDIEPGKYYELALFDAFPDYSVSKSPNDFTFANYRTFKSFELEEGDYVNIEYGGILISVEDLKSDLTHYGIYEVGKDIPAGEYKLETNQDEYQSDLEYIVGINGGYQITKESPEGTRVDSDMLFNSSQYVELNEGEFISIINARLTPTKNNSEVSSVSENLDNVLDNSVINEDEKSESQSVDLQTKEKETTEKLAALEAENSALQEKIKGLETEKKEQTEQLETLQNSVDSKNTVETENAELKEKIKNVEAENSALQEKIKGLETEKKEQAEQIEALQNSVDSKNTVETENAELKEKIKNVEAENTELEEQIQSLQSGENQYGQDTNDVEYAVEYDVSPDEIQMVEEILNYFGYDCGVPDETLEENTINAVKNFQQNQGMDATGIIDDDLLVRMTCGIPYDVFERRYNEAIAFLNDYPEITGLDTSLNEIEINDTDEEYILDDGLKLIINPEHHDKKMIGIMHLANEDSITGVSSVFTAELIAAVYAFDIDISSTLDAVEFTAGLINGSKDKAGDLVTYDVDLNYGKIMITGEYNPFNEAILGN